MEHTIATSNDGSSTLQLTQFGEAYHSTNGAYTEAMHIYIQCGVEHLFHKLAGTATELISGSTSSNTGYLPHTPLEPSAAINIFDVGFGTGLNCILAWAWQQQLRQKGLPYPRIHYWGIEKYPIPLSEIEQLNYPNIIAQHTGLLPDNLSEVFHFMHKCQWEKNVAVPEIPHLPHPGNKCTPQCSITTEMYHSGNKIASECATTAESPLSGNKYTPQCSTTTEMYHSGNKYASGCSTTAESPLSGNKCTSGCATTAESPLSGNKCTSGCSTNCGIFDSVKDYREEDFVLHKSCADIAALGAEYYKKACCMEEIFCNTCHTSPAVVFYDTFSPSIQPELWDEAIFRNIAAGCSPGSILVTYCSKGAVKQALRNTGFTLERLAGPPGKRHILRGTI